MKATRAYEARSTHSGIPRSDAMSGTRVAWCSRMSGWRCSATISERGRCKLREFEEVEKYGKLRRTGDLTNGDTSVLLVARVRVCHGALKLQHE